MPAIQKKQSKKLQQFLGEINKVCARYQYSFQAKIDVTATGIIPNIIVVEVPPKKEVHQAKKSKK